LAALVARLLVGARASRPAEAAAVAEELAALGVDGPPARRAGYRGP
jgi:hypothetical protein